LFDPAKSSFQFTNNLWSAGTNVSTYDRYTFYRLLSQLGTDSASEQNKMNLNYRNVTNGVVVPNLETNFYSWTAIEFFTNAADRMLRDYSQEWLAENPQAFTNTFGTIITNSFGITNIPVWVDGRFVYRSAIQRVLQLAANIYDATTTNTAAMGTNFPSVFRPIFEHDNLGNVFITGYTNLSSTFGPNTVTGTGDPQLALPYDVANVTNLSLNFTPITDASGIVNVYGVPWIIGAKKGFPNFNEFSMQGIVQVTRKLEIHRPTLTALPSNLQTNQMYIFSISNVFGVECWNSYSSNYLDRVLIWARDTNSMTLTNDNGMLPLSVSLLTANITNVPAQWPGTSQPWSQNPNPNFPSTNSFVIPLLTNVMVFTNSMYVYPPGGGGYLGNIFAPVDIDTVVDYPNVGIQPLPQFGLLTTNRLQVVMLDQDISGNYHVIDYVQFAGPDRAWNLNAELADVDPNGLGLWNTNLSGTVPNGVNNQINYSDNPIQNRANTLTANDDSTWVNPQGGGTVGDAIASFDSFLNQVINGSLRGMGTDPNTHKVSYATNTLLTVQVPFTPTKTMFDYISWQANDPLVHYVASDLNYSGMDYGGIQTGITATNKTAFPILPDLGQLNKRYQPWGVGSYPYSFSLKDSLIYSSDDWDFPTNKFPTVGWLGRVHRGTPWQTVYLKSPDVMLAASPPGAPITAVYWPETTGTNVLIVTNTNPWISWTGDYDGNGYDAVNMAPIQDRLLFDLFTTAFNDNATRGQLSVNVEAGLTNNPQAGLAAWSALFSGVEVLTNTASSLLNGVLYFPRPLLQITNFPINPTGPVIITNPPALWQIVTNINQTRTNFVNVDGLKGAFEHVGDILAVPQLSVQSPFLNTKSMQQQYGISDEMYEWLPQQAMSLLRVGGSPQTPMRYVIYSYGQALKPAPNSIYTGSGPLFGMVTNYQIVSEAATRAVVRFNSALANVVYFTNSPPTVTNQVINNNAVIERFNVLPPD
jgi:hypothetical protein